MAEYLQIPSFNQITGFPQNQVLCTDNCPVGGKLLINNSYYSVFTIAISPGISSQITTGATSIQVYGWSRLPVNDQDLSPRIFLAELPESGGIVLIKEPVISIFARNNLNSNFFDGVCCSVEGSTITLLSFGV